MKFSVIHGVSLIGDMYGILEGHDPSVSNESHTVQCGEISNF